MKVPLSFFFGNYKSSSAYTFGLPDIIAYGNSETSILSVGDQKSYFHNPLEAFERILSAQKRDSLFLGIALPYEFSEIISPVGSPSKKKYNIPNYLIYGFKLASPFKQTPKEYSLKNRSLMLETYSNHNRASYCQAIDKIHNYIRDGETYQVNLSQSFKIPVRCDPFTFFTVLMNKHSSEYSAFVDLTHTGDFQGSIFSHSPELFLKKSDLKIITKPIKGTRRRDLDPAIDTKLKTELSLSEKDHAELAMIVDLERNDLSKICVDNSIEVEEHATIVKSSNVYHLESLISGRLKADVHFLDILRATFPSGSISGAPKLATQKIIRDLEKEERGIYTGSIGVMEPNGDFILSVSIRSGFIDKEHVFFSSGGGITLSSRPSEEYDETLHKASAIQETVSQFLWP